MTSPMRGIGLLANTESIHEAIPATNPLSHSKAQVVGWQRRCQEQAPSSPSKDDDTEAQCRPPSLRPSALGQA